MNLKWAPSPEAIAAADESPWDGPLHRLARPISYDVVVRTNLATMALEILAAITVVLILPLVNGISVNARRIDAALVVVLVLAAGLQVVLLVAAPPAYLRRNFTLLATTYIPLQAVLTTIGIAFNRPASDAFIIFYAEAPIFAFYLLRPPLASLLAGLSTIEYGAVLIWQNDDPNAVVKWIVMTSVVFATGVIVGTIASHAEQLADSEKAARREVAAVNEDLESRVAEQVAELEHLNELRRFLPPAVASVVASQDRDALLAPHRRKIAVFFCDLRGFTGFTNQAEPEDVLAVLDTYFETVGAVLRDYGATIASYTGDGLIAFFGDPVPTEAPARDAVDMALALRERMVAVLDQWTREGIGLNHGVGIAYGHATLGVVGTDGRYDYTPLGSVVNLAARLCAKAKPGEILIDQAMHAATRDYRLSSSAGTFDLKGFASDVPAYALA